MVKILDELEAGRKPHPGPQTARRSSEPLAGLTALKEKVCPTASRLWDLVADHSIPAIRPWPALRGRVSMISRLHCTFHPTLIVLYTALL